MKYKIEGNHIRTEDSFPFALCGEGDNPFASELVRRANAFDGLVAKYKALVQQIEADLAALAEAEAEEKN